MPRNCPEGVFSFRKEKKKLGSRFIKQYNNHPTSKLFKKKQELRETYNRRRKRKIWQKFGTNTKI